MSAGMGALLAISAPAVARNGTPHAKGATAITQVFGDGIRLGAVAVEYDAPVKGADLSAAGFRVEGRTITGVFTSTTADPADHAAAGCFVTSLYRPRMRVLSRPRGCKRKTASRRRPVPAAIPETRVIFRATTRSTSRPRHRP